MKKFNPLLFTLSLLLVAFSVFYYLVIFLPKTFSSKELEKADVRTRLSACLNGAMERRSMNWDSQCFANNWERGCSLPYQLSKLVEETHQKDIDNCNKLIK